MTYGRCPHYRISRYAGAYCMAGGNWRKCKGDAIYCPDTTARKQYEAMLPKAPETKTRK